MAPVIMGSGNDSPHALGIRQIQHLKRHIHIFGAVVHSGKNVAVKVGKIIHCLRFFCVLLSFSAEQNSDNSSRSGGQQKYE